MAGDSDIDSDLEPSRDLSLRPADIGFRPDEMVTCGGCGKANPPNRGACLYCGAGIEGSETARLELREPESWENGFNVIIDAADADIERAAVHLAQLLRMERQNVLEVLSATAPLPLARVQSEEQAIGLMRKLNDLAVGSIIVDDESLRPNSPPTRLRSLTFAEADLSLGLFNSGERESVRREDLALIVRGDILETRSETVEKRKRTGVRPTSETETSSDEPVIDIYSKSDSTGWRIRATGFDFSCLEGDKRLTVAENIKALVRKLQAFAPGLPLDEDYSRIRSVLEHVWPSELTRDRESIGFTRKRVAKISRTNNLVQFTKYSRLRWHLYEKKI